MKRFEKAGCVASAAMGAYIAASTEWIRTEGLDDMGRLMDEALDALRTVLVDEPA